jgi:hypothetical protein
VTGSQNLNFYSTDLDTNQLLQTGYNSYVTHLTLADTGNDNVYLGNANGDIVQAGGGADYISVGVAGTTGEGTGDQLLGGTGANQTLIANLAGTTLVDGSGANQTLEAFDGRSTININSGPSDTVMSEGGNNIITVAAFKGTEIITATSTDSLIFDDSFSNAQFVKLASGAEQITFTDTGQVVDVTGLDQATFAGVLESFPVPPPPPPPYNPTSADMTPAALETLLTSQGFSSAAIAQAITHTLTVGCSPKVGLHDV